MNELLIERGLELLAVGAVAIAIYFLKNYAKTIVRAIVNAFVQQAEEKIQGSKLGAEKKKWVIAQLKAAGVKIDYKISLLIDELVAIMNKQK
jgi:hypothetical protein